MPSEEVQRTLLEILQKLERIDGKFETASVIDKQQEKEMDAVKNNITALQKLYDRVTRTEEKINTTRWAFGILLSIASIVLGYFG